MFSWYWGFWSLPFKGFPPKAFPSACLFRFKTLGGFPELRHSLQGERGRVRGAFTKDDLPPLQHPAHVFPFSCHPLYSFAVLRAKAVSEVTVSTDGIFSELILQKAHLGACRIGRGGALFHSSFEED